MAEKVLVYAYRQSDDMIIKEKIGLSWWIRRIIFNGVHYREYKLVDLIISSIQEKTWLDESWNIFILM